MFKLNLSRFFATLLIGATLIFSPLAAQALDTGFLSPTSESALTDWNNGNSAYSSDNQYATSDDNNNDDNEGHEQGYDAFNIPAIPAGSVINGVEVTLEARSTDTSGCSAFAAVSWNNGSNFTSAKNTTQLSGSDVVYTLGGPSDTWGRTWSVGDFTNANFVLKMYYDDLPPNTDCDNNNTTVSVDHVRVKVYHSPDTTSPVVTTIVTTGANPTGAASVSWTVNFTESVSGVTAADFALVNGGLGGTPAITTVSAGPASSYTVTATTGTGNGTLGLNLVDDDTIVDGAGNKLGGNGLGNGNAIGDLFTVDKTVPTPTITQAGGQIDPTNTSPVNFTVTFSESVTGFTAGDVTEGGTSGGTKTSVVTGSGTTYNVAVSGMTSSGTVTISLPAGAATDGVNTSAASVHTDNSVQYNLPTWDILTSATAGGTISPAGPIVTVDQGSNQAFNMVPSAGNILSSVIVDGVAQSTRPQNYTFSSVAANHSIVANFDGGWFAPTSGVQVSNSSGGMTPNNAFSSNDSYMVFDNGGDVADYTDFGLSIPAGATIDGIEVAIEGNRNGSRTADVALSWNGTSLTATKSFGATLGSGDTTVIIGGPSDTWGRSWTASELLNGNFELRIDAIVATNNLNVDQVQVKVYYTLDTTAPAGGSVTYTDGYFTTASVPVTYTLGTDAGAGINNASGKLQRASATLSGGTCSAFGSFSDLVTEFDGSYTDTSVVNGNCYQYQYVISDLAGTPNTATYTSANVAKVDTQNPVSTIDAALDGLGGTIELDGSTLTKSPVINFSFSGTDSESGVASYQCKLDGGVYAPCTSIKNYSGLSDGVHTVYVSAVDVAGNIELTATLTWEVDQTAPVITVLGDQPDSVVYGATYTDDGATALDARDGDLTLDIVAVNPVGVTSPVGPYSVTYNVTDAAGNAAVQQTRTVNVTEATVTVTADPQTKVYGEADPAFTFEYSGFVNGDDEFDIDTPPTCAVAGPHEAATTYTIVCAGGSDNNYTFVFVDDVFTVTPKPLTITADNQTKVYGDLFTFVGDEFTTSALVVGDSVTSVTLTSTGAPVVAGVATYDIVTSDAVGTGLSNYAISYVDGDLAVTALPVTVTADPDQTKVYGAGDPTFTYSGTLVNTDTFSGALSRVSGEDVGPYAITQGTLTAGSNYTITFVSDLFTITPATLTVVADPQTKVYGAGDPTLTYVPTGFQFGDNAGSVLTGALTRASGEAVAGSPYAISQGTLVANGNYTIAFTGNGLTITPASLTITASSDTFVYGGTVPTITPSYIGLTNSDLAPATLPTCATVATAASPVGPYASSCLGAADTNYTIGYIDGIVTVTKAQISVEADDKSKVYGEANPTLTGVITGIRNGDAITANYTTVADANSAVGEYDIVPELLGAALSNYDIPDVTNGTLTITQATSTVTVVCTDVTYTGSAQTPCTGTVTGVNLNLDITGSLVYADNTLAGVDTASASYTYAGDVNHTGNSGSDTFSIGKADSTTVVTCPVSVVFNNAAQTPCTVAVTSTAGLNLAPTASYTLNVDAGTATASYNFLGDANHNGSTDSTTFEITKADTTTIVTCTAGPFAYTGLAIEPCSATVTGPGLSDSVTVVYGDNVDTGTATASATYAESANYNTSTDSDTFEISSATSTTVITCPVSVVYDGDVQTPCTVSVTGAGGLNLAPTPVYASNTNVGTASASYTYAGDDNHSGSSDSETFGITAADAVCTIAGYTGIYDALSHGATGTCTGVNDEVLTGLTLGASFTNVPGGTASWSFTNDNYASQSGDAAIVISKADADITVTGYNVSYDGNPHTATGSALGVLGEALVGLDLSGTTHTAAGTYPTDAWTFTDVTGNYNDANGTVADAITAAATVTTVTCDPASVTYTGSAHEHCTAQVVGVGLSESVSVTYTGNVDAGVAEASASYAGTENYAASSDTANFTIDKAPSTTVVTCSATEEYTGAAIEPCTVAVTGAGALSLTPDPEYSNNTAVGLAGATYTYAGGTNHLGSTDSESFTITPAGLTPSIIASDKAYDGTNVAVVTCAVVPILGGDDVTCTPTSATFASANVGTHLVTATGITLGGADAGNYTLTTDTATDTADITEATTTTTISVAPEPSVVGQSYTVSWTVTATAGTPTGTVDVTVDSNPGCSAAVEAGECQIVGTAAGTNDLVATYSGDGNFDGSASGSTEHVVAKAATTLDITNQGALNTATTIGGTYAVNWSVAVTQPGAGTPTGTVTVTDGTDECTAAVAAGTCSLISMTSGDKDITATYEGDTNFLGSSDTATHDVDKQALVVIADSQTKVYGEADPTFSYSLTGFVDGVDETLNTPPTCTASGAHINVGTYAITCGGGADDNYSFVYFPGGTLTVTKAPLVITASSEGMTYGGTVPTITASYATFVNGDDATDLDVLPTCGTTATAASPVGTYGSACAGAADTNYTFSYVAGSVEVAAAALTITADDQTKEFGDADAALTYQITAGALVNGDTVTGALTRDAGEAVGTYAITQGTVAVSGNYALTFVPGTLTIEDTTAPETTITVSPVSPTNDNTPTFEFTSTEPGTFTCQMDAELASSCATPFTASALSEGEHTFLVYATDAEDNADLTPATVTFEVDAVGPEMTDVAASNPTDTTITVTWTTDHPATSRVVYDTVSVPVAGAAPNYGYTFSTVEDPTLTTSHSVVVTGLTSGTQYWFRGVSHGSPESVTDEVTNTTLIPPPTQGTVTVTKIVANSDTPVSAFPLFVGDTEVVSGVPTAFDAGTYTVYESTALNFTPSFSGACVADETNESRLNLIADFQAKKDALQAAIDASPEDTEGNAVKAAMIVDVNEKILALQNSLSATITVVAGEDVTCTITNTYVPPAATDVSVHIFKYVDGVLATAEATNSTAFPMLTTFNSTTYGSATDAPFTLSPTGWGAGDSAYEASFPHANVGADYTARENLTTSVVGEVCGAVQYSLVGYTSGDTLEAAAAAEPTLTAPAFVNLQSDKYVIVWNHKCGEVEGATTLKVHIYKYLDGVLATNATTGGYEFPMSATWMTANLNGGASTSGDYVLGNNHGGNASEYGADTSPMEAPADYTTYEITGGDSQVLPIGAECVEGKYRLVGYSEGPDLNAALVATKTNTAPVYTDLVADRTVIVWNEKCGTPVPEIVNSCPVPSTLEDTTVEEIGNTPESEDELSEILDDAGYMLDITGDQKQFQIWNVAANSQVIIDAKFVDKFAGHTAVFGYYKDGSLASFVPVFKTANIAGYEATPLYTAGPFTVPTGAVGTLGFAIKTWNGANPAGDVATENALNTGGSDQVVAFNPASNTYVLAFEDLIAGDSDYNDLVVEVHLACSLMCVDTAVTTTVVSDTTTLEGGLASVLVNPLNVRWTALIEGASWIWGENPVSDPTVDLTETFTKSFNIVGTPTGGELMIAADNKYSVTLNGEPLCADDEEFNYQSEGDEGHDGQDTCTIPAEMLDTGANEIVIVVSNIGREGAEEGENPAGLLYKLTLNETQCLVPEEVVDVCSNIGGVQTTMPEGMVSGPGNSCVVPVPPPPQNMGTVVIKKVTVGGTGSEVFSFSPSYDVAFELGAGQTATTTEFSGTHEVEESSTEGWTLTSVTCVDPTENSTGNTETHKAMINLAAGETVTCTFVNTKNVVDEEEDEDEEEESTPAPSSNGGGGGGGGGNFNFASFGGGFGGGNGSVLGASTGQVLGESCGLFMGKHLKKNSAKNDSEQVTKLQTFLIKHGFGAFTPTGYFGPLTEEAVKAFQLAHKDDILKPWGIDAPTGLVYLSTLKTINKIECPSLTLDLPALVPWSANPNAQ